MGWKIRFIPNECDSISVMINNEYWTRWFRSSGDKTQDLPQRFVEADKLKIGATVSPERKNGTIEVYYNNDKVKTYNFDNYEDHDLRKPGPPPPRDPGPRRPDPILPSEDINEESYNNVSNFFSGTLSNVSVGPPEPGTKEFAFITNVNQEAGGEPVAADTKTFRQWQFLPWVLRSSNGVDLTKIEALTVSLLRAVDPSTGANVVQSTLAFRQSSHGWQVPAVTLRVWFLNSAEGLLEEWEATNKHSVVCGDSQAFKSYEHNVRPDWYDVVAQVVVIISPATWHKCR